MRRGPPSIALVVSRWGIGVGMWVRLGLAHGLIRSSRQRSELAAWMVLASIHATGPSIAELAAQWMFAWVCKVFTPCGRASRSREQVGPTCPRPSSRLQSHQRAVVSGGGNDVESAGRAALDELLPYIPMREIRNSARANQRCWFGRRSSAGGEKAQDTAPLSAFERSATKSACVR